MKARIFVDVTDVKSYIGVVRFERAVGIFTILSGHQVDLSYSAVRIDKPILPDVYERQARVTGIDLNLHDIVPADSTDAWRLLTWAATFGVEHQRELLHQLWRARFLEGADVADHFALASRAALAGLDLDEAERVLGSVDFADDVELQRQTARSIGVTTTPYVVVDGERTITGLRSQDDYIDALHRIHSGA